MEGMLRVAAAAKFLGFSKGNVYQLAHRGALPSYKAEGSKALWFEKNDLIEYKKNLKKSLKPRPVAQRKNSAPKQKSH